MTIKKQNFSLSSLFQLSFLIFGLILAVFLTDQAQKYLGRANSSPAPREITITNLSETSFTVSWLTEKPAEGLVILKNLPAEGQEKVFFDDRSGTYTSNSLFTTHQVTISNLKADQAYSFLIQSGKDKYPIEYEAVTLLPVSTTSLSPVMIYGIVSGKTSQPAANVLVYLTSPAATMISTLTDQNGNFVLNLSNRRTKDLTNYFSSQAGEKVILTFKSSPGEISQKEIILTGADQNLGSLPLSQNGLPNTLTANKEAGSLNQEPEKLTFWQKVILFFKTIFSKP